MQGMKFRLVLVSFLVIWFGFSATETSYARNKPQVDLVQSSASGFTVNVTFPQPEIQTKTVNNQTYETVDIAGTNVAIDQGAPELPVWSELYAIPDGATVNVHITDQQTTIRRLSAPVFPHQMELDHPDPQATFAKQTAIYEQNTPYPNEAVTISRPMVLRDLNLVGLNVYPVQYNPADQNLKITQSITVQVDFQGGSMPSLDKPVSEAFLPIYQQYVRNWKDFVSEDNVQRGTLLIITPTAYESNLEPLVRWKLQEGFTVHVATTSDAGTTTGSIKNYISNYYNNVDPNLEFVLLIGDESGTNSIPTYTYNSDVGDRQYGQLVGNDYLPEVVVGRYSVSNLTELNILMMKQIHYEKNPYQWSNGWLSRALNVGTYYHAYSILEIMHNVTKMMEAKHFTQIDSAYYPATSGETAVTIIENAINRGVGFVNYRGWAGSSGWYEPSYHTTDLQSDGVHNGLYNGIMTSIVCGTGNFGTSECFGEAWLRLGTPSNPKGGVAFYGSTEFNQNVRYANIIDASFYYGAIRRGIRSMGTAMLFSKMAVYEGFPNNREDTSNFGVEFYFHIYNMLGDPSLQMWVGSPNVATVTFPTTISTAAPYIPVRVKTLFGENLQGVHVTLLPQNSEDTVISTVTSDRGYAALNVGSLPPGQYELTISGSDIVPVTQTLTITEQALALSLDDWGIDDSQNGNSDGLWEPGETIEFSPTLDNVGSISSDTVTAELTVLHPNFTVLTSTTKYLPIDSGNVAVPLHPFVVQVNDSISDFRPADLQMEIHTADTTRTYSFLYTREFARGMPAFNIESITPHMDGDIWQPGEIINLELQLQNDGPIDATNVTGWLSTSHDSLQILDNESGWGDLADQGESSNSDQMFRVKASPNTIPGSVMNLTLHVSPSNGTVQEIPFNMTVGAVSTTDPVGPDEYGYYIFDNGDNDYSQAPTYNWVEIAPNQSGNGTIVPLTDHSEDSDDNYYMELPFDFRMYGNTYTGLTVNSNGFLGMGHSRWFAQRNWPIPGPLGAEGAMIAGYWDDLYLQSGSQVASYYDETNHRFIIEYSQMGNIISSSATETFEIILYDPTAVETPTGDGEIVVQYKHIDEAPGSGGRDNASTVGIMNDAHDVGIEYLYAQHYQPGAAPLGTGRAIRYTTNPGTATAPADFAEMNMDTLLLAYSDTLYMSRNFVLKNAGNLNLSYQAEVLYDSTLDWLSVDPANTTLGSHQDQVLSFSVDTTGLTNDYQYIATLHITSNAMNYSDISIPVELYFNRNLTVGDINMDGEVTIEDVAAAQGQILGTSQLNPLQQILADQDGDHIITIKDIVKILKTMGSH